MDKDDVIHIHNGILCCVSHSVVLTLCDPMDCSPQGSSVHRILQARILEGVVVLIPRGIFTTQGSNLGLLHCLRILYHLSHKNHVKIWKGPF